MFKRPEQLSPDLSIYFNSIDEYNQVIKDLLHCIDFSNIDWFADCGISADHFLRVELIEVKIEKSLFLRNLQKLDYLLSILYHF